MVAIVFLGKESCTREFSPNRAWTLVGDSQVGLHGSVWLGREKIEGEAYGLSLLLLMC